MPNGHAQKNEIEPLSYNINQKTNQKRLDLRIRHETIKLIDENVGGQLLDIDLGEDSLF